MLRVDGVLRAVSVAGVFAPESPKSVRPVRVSAAVPRAGAFTFGVERVVTGVLPLTVLLRVTAVWPRCGSDPRDVSEPRAVRVEGTVVAGLPPTTPPLTVERLKVTGLLPEGRVPLSFRRATVDWPWPELRAPSEVVRTVGGVVGNSGR